jgi:hypothetical protein
MRKILIVSAVVGIVLCGCGGFLGYRGLTMVKQITKAKVTQQQFDALQVGQSETSVRQALPTPLDASVYAGDDAVGKDVPAGATCVYFRAELSTAPDGTPLFRFCFADGRLADKRTVKLGG